jgi:hypothetical protein
MEKILACMRLMKGYLHDHQEEISKNIRDSPILKKREVRGIPMEKEKIIVFFWLFARIAVR